MRDHLSHRWTLFLDFDGVLNGERFLRYQRNHVAPSAHRLFDPDNMQVLDRLCTALPVESIVVTSSWRLDRSVLELRALLADGGLASAGLVAAVTPSIGPSPESRAGEILEYVAEHEVSHWVALDDFELAPWLGTQFHRTSAASGLTAELVERTLQASRAS